MPKLLKLCTRKVMNSGSVFYYFCIYFAFPVRADFMLICLQWIKTKKSFRLFEWLQFKRFVRMISFIWGPILSVFNLTNKFSTETLCTHSLSERSTPELFFPATNFANNTPREMLFPSCRIPNLILSITVWEISPIFRYSK